MIEDALKSTRNLHRLIVAVSLITLVFSLSLNLPRDKIALKEAIDRLIETDFLAYDQFVQEKVGQFAQANLRPIGQHVNERLDAGGRRIFQLRHIGEVLAEPLHIGKLLIDELVLKDVAAASLTQLDALNGLDLGRNVQVLKPQAADLVELIEAFLNQHDQGTKRVESVRAGIGDFDFTAQSFLPDDTATPALYFELRDSVLSGGAPVFNESFGADIETLSETSFLYWVQQTFKRDDPIAVQGRKLVFLPELSEIPTGLREEKLGALSLRLDDEIKSRGPENLSATILGTQVPGLLIVLASPTVLLFLSYYLMQHTSHLRDLPTDDMQAFRQFAWLPLALPGGRQATQENAMRMPSPWALETVATIIILPVVSLFVLYVQLNQFGGLKLYHALLLVATSLIIGWMGIGTTRHIKHIRSQLVRPPVSASIS